jgi:CheY-like chemotaxis protein
VPKQDHFPNESLVLQARFGAAVKSHRLRLGVTQEELAWRADLHRSYLADIERGGRNVTLCSIVNLARALQITLTDLLSNSVDLAIINPQDEARPGLGEILLVEDDASDIELTLRAFKRAKFANPVKVARDGKAALDYLFRTGRFAKRRDVMPQLVLLDLNLPKISGLEVLRRIKGHELTQAIPVVILTGSQQDHNIIECGRLGAENYLIKPVEFETFSQVTPKLGLHWTLVRPLAANQP